MNAVHIRDQKHELTSSRDSGVYLRYKHNFKGYYTATNTHKEAATIPITKATPDSPAKVDTPVEVDEDQEIPSKPMEAGYGTAPPHIKLLGTDKLEEMKPPPPFPQRLKKQNQEYQFKKFFAILKQLHINLPLVEAL
ncbi:hypothetical protein V6N12_038493 [Hibiscus sabdariffa]|uniref:Reverse transcriptase domain-containing protein n=1 Tax=Hibiscus sabdariffa TaxID=183260 RepID=A0ABR2BHT0_9ROSI